MGRRIGLFGGTFDPPHLGHLLVAEWVRDALHLDQMRLLVAGRPWMKGQQTPGEHRVAMVRAACHGDPYLVVDGREVGVDGPTYTADTLAVLHDDEPGVAWTFVVGADAAASLPRWHEVGRALELATFVVVRRPGTPLPDHELADRLVPVDAPLVELSSTAVRARVGQGRSIRHLVPSAVRAYIEEHALYRPPSHG